MDEQNNSSFQTGYGAPASPKRNWVKYLAPAIITLAILGGAYFVIFHPKTTPAAKPAAAKAPASAKTSSATKNYSSPNFYLAFDYPSNWTVVDTGGGIMTVKSPLMNLKNPAGQTVSGQIVLTITQAGQVPSAFNSGGATAVRDSQKITYLKPTATQRANTYLSFVQYTTTTAAGALDGVYITGDYGYQKAQDVPKVDIAKLDPIISITFLNGAGKAMSIQGSEWDNASFFTPLLNIFKSLAIT